MRLLACLALLAAAPAMTGCVTQSSDPDLTGEQRLVRNETTIRVASALATKAAIVAVEDRSVDSTARSVNRVAADVVTATEKPGFLVGAVRGLAAKTVAEQRDLTLKQRLVAGQLVDTIAMLVQAHVENGGGVQDDETVRRLVRAAAKGVLDATAPWASQQ